MYMVRYKIHISNNVNRGLHYDSYLVVDVFIFFYVWVCMVYSAR